MEQLTRFVLRHKLLTIGIWVGLVIFGGYGAGQLTDRWQQDFSLPGQPAYEANSRVMDEIGSGRQYPITLVYTSTDGQDLRSNSEIEQSIADVAAASPRSRVSSFFDTGGEHLISEDGSTMWAIVYPGGPPKFDYDPTLFTMQETLAETTPEGIEAHMTGVNPVFVSQSGEEVAGNIFVEVAIGAAGAVLILLVVFGTLPAVLMPLMVAMVSIMTAFGAVYVLTYATDVSIIVQFLIGLVGLGIAIDYALLVIFRYREELAGGAHPDDAIIETMKRAGHSVIVSGTTVGIGLLGLIVLPVPLVRGMGLGGMVIPVVSVLASITLLPVVLAMVGPRINRFRIPLLWRVANLESRNDAGFWVRWSAFVTRRPWPVFLVGALLVGALMFPAFDMSIANSQVRNQPVAGDAKAGLDALAEADAPDGVFGPVTILVEGDASQADIDALVASASKIDGVRGATAPASWSDDSLRLIEVVPDDDPSAPATTDVIDELNDRVLPAASALIGDDVTLTVAGTPAEDRAFGEALYDNFWLVLLVIVSLTFILLARALRSIMLPLKAVLLNLLSLGAAYGVIVFVIQNGHGSEAIWGLAPTESIVAWIPLMIFAFLFGISMDYEVFMLTRIREAYNAGADTSRAVAIGLSRTGKLVTSGAAILMFTFIVFSTQPGAESKQFGIGLAAGIAIDATLIRVLLVPTMVALLGRANWWFPEIARKLLMLPVDPSVRGMEDLSEAAAAPQLEERVTTLR